MGSIIQSPAGKATSGTINNGFLWILTLARESSRGWNSASGRKSICRREAIGPFVGQEGKIPTLAKAARMGTRKFKGQLRKTWGTRQHIENARRMGGTMARSIVPPGLFDSVPGYLQSRLRRCEHEAERWHDHLCRSPFAWLRTNRKLRAHERRSPGASGAFWTLEAWRLEG